MVLLTFKSDAVDADHTFVFTPTLINYEEVFLKPTTSATSGLHLRIGRTR
jgi:hypothetical protein